MRSGENRGGPRAGSGTGRPGWSVAALAVAASGMIAAATVGGAGVAPDSVDYVMTARELRAGHGVVVHDGPAGLRPLVHFPPLFPAALALLGLAGPDPLEAARWLNAALAGGLVALVGVSVRRVAPRSPRPDRLPALSALLVALAPPLRGHAWVLSEPLFLVLGFGALLALARGLERRSAGAVAAAGALVGAAVLCRWAGFAFALAGLLGLATLAPGAWPGRRRAGCAFAVTAFGPGLLWMLRNATVGTSASGRSLAWHPMGSAHAGQLGETLSAWILGNAAIAAGAVALACALAAARGIALHRPAREATPTADGSPVLRRLLVLFLAAYAALLVASISLVDFHTPLNERILAPAFVACVPLAAHGARRALARAARPALRAIAVGATGVLLAGLGVETGRWLAASLREGQPILGRRDWGASEVVARAAALPAHVHLYSNGADALYLLLGRRASDLPVVASPATRRPNPRFGAQMRRVAGEVRAGRGAIVWLDSLAWRTYFPRPHDLRRLGLPPTAGARDGVIFAAGSE